MYLCMYVHTYTQFLNIENTFYQYICLAMKMRTIYVETCKRGKAPKFVISRTHEHIYNESPEWPDGFVKKSTKM
jgi:hypothetical protein